MAATKEQEREALKKIRKIVEGLGEYSYIGTALEGVWEIAEQNIEWDAALSHAGKCKDYESQIKAAEAVNEKQAKEIAEMMIDIAEVKADLENALTDLAEERKSHKADYQTGVENWNNFREQQDRADALEREVMELKAKLYDFMTAQ